MRQELIALDQLEPGQLRSVVLDGLHIVVARSPDGSVHALHDRCPHAGARLSYGSLLQNVVGDDVDEYRLTDESVLRCPWHGYEFDLSTGRCLSDPERVRVRVYELVVEDGTVWLERGTARGRRTARAV